MALKSSLILILPILSTLTTYAQASLSGFDVRSVRWWMTKAQVMASEKKKPKEQSLERLVYENIKVGDDYANLLYEFNSNKLVSMTYTFTKLGGILYLPFISYSAIDRKVSQRFGKPVDVKEKWRSDKSQYSITNGYADAIEAGQLVLITIWLTDRTQVAHVMNSDAHGLSYTSRLTPKPASQESKDF